MSITFSNFTTFDDENVYGISAQVVRYVDPLPIMCQLEPCPITHFQLVVDSEIPAKIEQYKICNGFSCIQNKEIRYETKGNLGLIPLFEIESWKIGEMVSIKVEASTVYDEKETHPQPIPIFIDLGESKIKELENIDSANPEPENFAKTLQGNDAQAICSALRIPCPSNPIFSHVTLTNDEYFLTYTTPEDFFEIKLNQTHVCLKSEKFQTTRCDER